MDSNEAEEYFKGETSYQNEVFRALENEWDTILEGKYNNVEALLYEVYRRGKAKGYSDMRSRIRYTEQDKLALQFVRDYNFGLIQRLNDDTIHQIKNTIIGGFLAGDHPYKIAPKILEVAENRLEGSTFSPKQRAVMIARTEVSRVQNTGILQSYVNEGYTEVKILTAEDSNVCTTCLKYAFKFNEDEPIIYENRREEKTHNILKLIKGREYPPFHPNCRCTYLSVWKTKGEPLEKPPVIWLIPDTFFDFDEGVSTNDEKREWTLNSLKQALTDKVDSEDINLVSEIIIDNLDNLPNSSHEFISAYDTDFNVKCRLITSGKKSEVTLPNHVSEFGKENGLGLVIHNHTSGVPFPSINDVVEGTINLKIKYNVIITSNNRIVILKNSNSGLLTSNKEKRLVRGIMEGHDLIDYEYNNSFLRSEIIEGIRNNPVSVKKKIELIANGRCEFTNDNFYKYCNILNKKFSGTHVSISEIK